MISDKIKEYNPGDTAIWYLDEGAEPFVDFVQMQVPDRTIHVIHPEDLTDTDMSSDMVITVLETGFSDRLEAVFHEKITANSFCLYYN